MRVKVSLTSAAVEEQLNHRKLPVLAGDVEEREVVLVAAQLHVASAVEPLLHRRERAEGDGVHHVDIAAEELD